MERTERATPNFVAKLNGIQLSVWENETDGRRWYSSGPSRRYVENGSTEAKYTTTFRGIADLILLREAINQAIGWISGRGLGESEE
jgi:hypothetical protein